MFLTSHEMLLLSISVFCEIVVGYQLYQDSHIPIEGYLCEIKVIGRE